MLYMYVIYLSAKNKVSTLLLYVKYVCVNVMIMATANIYVTTVADLSPLVVVSYVPHFHLVFMMCVSI